MTAPYGTSGNEPITAPGIHDMPSDPVPLPVVKNFGEATVKMLIAHVLYAISGINVFGVSLLDPFGLLRAFADELVQQANDAYNNAANAQTSADTANTGVAQLFAIIDGIVSGGVSFSDTFDRSGSGLGADYTERELGPGAGSWGTNGFDLNWSSNGATPNTRHGRRNVALSTDYQAAQIIVGTPSGGTDTSTAVKLILRSNAAQDANVMATISTGQAGSTLITDAEIGYTVGDVYTRIGAIEPVTFASGDRWEFRAGTLADDYQFQLFRNGALVVDRTDSAMASQMGADYRYPGVGMRAGVSIVFFFFQVAATPIQALSAADRTPS